MAPADQQYLICCDLRERPHYYEAFRVALEGLSARRLFRGRDQWLVWSDCSAQTLEETFKQLIGANDGLWLVVVEKYSSGIHLLYGPRDL